MPAPSMLAMLALLAAPPADAPAAAVGGAFELRPAAPTSGGGYSAGGAFELEGSLGQPDATSRLSGGAFSLTGGIRLERTNPTQAAKIFHDGFESKE